MVRWFILDSFGTPQHTPMFEAACWLDSNQSCRQLMHTSLPPFCISTVFLSLDHGWGDGPPVLWETMVFNSGYEGPGLDDLIMERYSCPYEARRRHIEIIQEVQAMRDALV